MKICKDTFLNNFSFKLKPYPHLLITSKLKKINTAKTYANVIIINPANKDDIPLYKHELEHVKQFYNLFKGDFTLFNKCKRETEAYLIQIKEQLKENNYNKNIININKYATIIHLYCNTISIEDITIKINNFINLLIYKRNFNIKIKEDINR